MNSVVRAGMFKRPTSSPSTPARWRCRAQTVANDNAWRSEKVSTTVLRDATRLTTVAMSVIGRRSAVLPSGARVPSGEVHGGNPAAFVRKLNKEELVEFEMHAMATTDLAAKHADEFLPYGEMFQLKAELASKGSK